MTRDRVHEYLIEKDSSRAEAMLRVLSDEYCPDIPNGSAKLMDGFGGGMGCGKACGALCGGHSAIGYRFIHEGARATPKLKLAVAVLAEGFVGRSSSNACCKLVKTYRKEDTCYLDMICMAAGIADACSGRIISEEREQSR